MAKTAADIYHQLLTEEPIVVSVAGMAAMGAALREFSEQDRKPEDIPLSEFMDRLDEHLEFLAEMYPSEDPE